MNPQIQDLFAQLKGLWRYRWMALGVAWLVCLVGWAGAYLFPDTYEAEAQVYVDTSSALRDVIENLTINTDVRSRVDLVTTLMLGRPQLEKVARKTDLHLRAKTSQEFDSLIGGMRTRINIQNDERRDPNVFTISYSDIDPVVAKEVVDTLVSNFQEDVLGEKLVDTQRAQEFLRDQLRQLDSELSEAEQKLAEFKRENVGQMPGERGDYFGRLQAQMDALEETRAEIRLAERRQQALRQQMAGESQTMESAGIQSDLDRRIDEHEARLEELQLRFTERHPDVIAIKETLAELKAQKEAELQALRDSGGTGAASDNPVYQNIQMEMSKVDVELAALREQEASQQRKIQELRGLIDILPRVEAELKRLTRDYGVKQAQYQSLLQRLEVAELTESAEASEDVDFRVMEPASLPKSPASPNRPALIAMTLLAGLGGGGALAFLLNQLNPVFNNARMLREATGLPVLGTVQTMRTRERKRWRLVQISSFGAGLAVLGVAFVAVFLMHDTGSQWLQRLV
ncbi:MAG TPA: XrtA system polysaccharide chain length determinant [Woeseiaceae bacterium]|nr:XrtA system polysaccharide chain length determinant [Woeseiaceae bacterium]